MNRQTNEEDACFRKWAWDHLPGSSMALYGLAQDLWMALEKRSNPTDAEIITLKERMIALNDR